MILHEEEVAVVEIENHQEVFDETDPDQTKGCYLPKLYRYFIDLSQKDKDEVLAIFCNNNNIKEVV